jgi:glycosyltransferase involved in cell wall biosynthesis
VNGTRAEEQNEALKAILSSLRPEDMEKLGDRHGMRCPDRQPWLKNLAGGSDDHSLLYVACRYTEVPQAKGLDDFFLGLEKGNARVGGVPSDPEYLAHSVYSIAYQYYRHRLGLRHTGRGGPLLKFMDRSLLADGGEKQTLVSRLARFYPKLGLQGFKNLALQSAGNLFQREILRMLLHDPQLKETLKSDAKEPALCRNQWFAFVKGAANQSLFQFRGQIFQDDEPAARGILPFLTSIVSAGALGMLAGPYIGAFAHAAADRRSSRRVLARLFPSLRGNGRARSIGCFYDTPEGMLRSLFSCREKVLGCAWADSPWTGITCHDQNVASERGVKVFRPVGRFVLGPAPVPPFPMPSFLDLLKYCYDSNFTCIHSFTPGPMGLAALGIARILRLPIRATIHGALSCIAQGFAGDPSAEAHFWKYASWYYGRMEQINVPSRWAARELSRRGVPEDKMRVFSPPVNLERFNPAKRNGYLEKRFSLTGGIYLFYAGWIANESDVHLLQEVFTRLSQTLREVRLICAREGPERPELRKNLTGAPLFFTGTLEEEDLALLLASCDVFVSPGTTDLAGDLVLRAQASGLPAVVTDAGCFREHIIPGKTGLIAKAGDVSSLFLAVEALIKDPLLRQGMGRAARRFMEERNAIADSPQSLF